MMESFTDNSFSPQVDSLVCSRRSASEQSLRQGVSFCGQIGNAINPPNRPFKESELYSLLPGSSCDLQANVRHAIHTLQKLAPEELAVNHFICSGVPAFAQQEGYGILQCTSDPIAAYCHRDEAVGFSGVADVMLQSDSSLSSLFSSSSDPPVQPSGELNTSLARNTVLLHNHLHQALEGPLEGSPAANQLLPSCGPPLFPNSRVNVEIIPNSNSSARARVKRRRKGQCQESLVKRRKKHMIAERIRRDQFRKLCNHLRESIVWAWGKRRSFPETAHQTEMTNLQVRACFGHSKEHKSDRRFGLDGSNKEILGNAVKLLKLLQVELEVQTAREQYLDQQIKLIEWTRGW